MRRKRLFISNSQAVVDLPMRLTVGLIIGAIALVAILSYIFNPGLFVENMIVSSSSSVLSISGDDPVDLPELMITVSTSDGQAVFDAMVIVSGLGDVSAASTDANGVAVITDHTVQIKPGSYEGYLGIKVKAAGYETFDQSDMIKIVKDTV